MHEEINQKKKYQAVLTVNHARQFSSALAYEMHRIMVRRGTNAFLRNCYQNNCFPGCSVPCPALCTRDVYVHWGTEQSPLQILGWNITTLLCLVVKFCFSRPPLLPVGPTYLPAHHLAACGNRGNRMARGVRGHSYFARVPWVAVVPKTHPRAGQAETKM